MRLLPYLFVLYIIAFLDRVNVGFAGLEMSRDLGFSDRVFSVGAGIFFVGYFLLEIPGAIIVERWSARKWIARILITWGIVTISMAFVHTRGQFYTVGCCWVLLKQDFSLELSCTSRTGSVTKTARVPVRFSCARFRFRTSSVRHSPAGFSAHT